MSRFICYLHTGNEARTTYVLVSVLIQIMAAGVERGVINQPVTRTLVMMF